ncbi:hypothetical protein M0R45_011045 [Rubus argutus]|uniref:DUF7952 domain-containing protein n=1 Tax=Rubus argutus TaxID=59490 RepID=A0AAW1Y917_RUBAR
MIHTGSNLSGDHMGSAQQVDNVGDGKVLSPRIGTEYQAVIPPLLAGARLNDEDSEEKLKLPPWSLFEIHSFILGLYIFGKNLRFVKRFVGSKEMKEVLAFYYGDFYASDAYRRWSEWGKWKGKEFLYGVRIWELLSRLFPLVSNECQALLMQNSRKFLRKKISYQEYIFMLKDAVGLHMLIEAFGIEQRGKKDLTSTAFKPKSSDEDWSSLTPAQLLMYLISFRQLRKARMNDKWKYFFWTIASDPSALGLGNEEAADPNLPKKQVGRFLNPSTVSSSRNGMNFTIVDTSTLHGAEENKVSELRSLLDQPASLSPPSDLPSETEEDGKISVDTEMPNTADPACNQEELSCCRIENLSDDDKFQCQSYLPSQREGQKFQVHPQNSSSTTYLEKGGPSGDNEGSVNEDFLDGEPSPGAAQSRIWIDLNAAYGSPHLGTDQPFISNTMQSTRDSCANKSSVVLETRQQQVEEVEVPEVGASVEEQQPIVNSQRHSTRSRPLTRKAWEALENDFGSTKRKRRG